MLLKWTMDNGCFAGATDFNLVRTLVPPLRGLARRSRDWGLLDTQFFRSTLQLQDAQTPTASRSPLKGGTGAVNFR